MLKIKTVLTHAIVTSMLLTHFATSPLAAQSDAVMNIKLQVLSWAEDIDDIDAMVAQVGAEPVLIAAEQKRVSAIYDIKTSNLLTLYHPANKGTDLGQPMVSVALKPGMREVLLILSEQENKYRAAVLPFAQKNFPDNTATIFNLTKSPVVAHIDGETQEIKAKARYQVPYEYAYAKKESLRTKFAVEQNGRMRLVQNGFVPVVNNGRVLFFIRENTAKSNRQTRDPVTFTYAYDVMSSRLVQPRTDRDSTN